MVRFEAALSWFFTCLGVTLLGVSILAVPAEAFATSGFSCWDFCGADAGCLTNCCNSQCGPDTECYNYCAAPPPAQCKPKCIDSQCYYRVDLEPKQRNRCTQDGDFNPPFKNVCKTNVNGCHACICYRKLQSDFPILSYTCYCRGP